MVELELRAPTSAITSYDALAFVAELHREFGSGRADLLARRNERARAIAAGERPDFLSSTASIRSSEWRIDPVPGPLRDRRVVRVLRKKVEDDLKEWKATKGGRSRPRETNGAGQKAEQGTGEGGAKSAGAGRSAKPPQNRPKRGRPVDKATIRRADFAKPLREDGSTWLEIAKLYCKKYPRDLEASADTIRLAFQRQYPAPK